MMTPIGRLCAAAPIILIASAALAQSGEWGALAISERSTTYGFSYDHESQDAASVRAMRECGRHARDCRVHTTFRNTCLVIAASKDGPFGWAWGGREDTRDTRALKQCRQRGAINCQVVQRVCSGTTSGRPAARMPAPRDPVARDPVARDPAPPAARSGMPPAAYPPAGPPAAGQPPSRGPGDATPGPGQPPDRRVPGAPLQLHRQ